MSRDAVLRQRRLAVKYFRLLKYAMVAPAAAILMKHTKLLDGKNGVPPSMLNYSGGGDFVQMGDHLTTAIVREVPVDRSTRWLDIGCGIGRLASGLKRNQNVGVYAGFDVVRYGILWCRKTIQDPRFHFEHADIQNSFYNPFGKVRPESYSFPYEDESFDLAVALSVFTHLPEASSRRYFTEAMRCLVPGGRAYFTTFLPERATRASDYSLTHSVGAARLEGLEEPDLAVGYSRAFWETLAAEHGAVVERVLPGSWAGTRNLPNYQDVIIFRKLTAADTRQSCGNGSVTCALDHRRAS